MSIPIVESPLLDRDFEAAISVCLQEAMMAGINLDRESSQKFLEMKERFENALRKRMMGFNSILDLGLELKDLFWGADRARKVYDREAELRFRTAAMRLQAAPLQK